MFLQIRIFVSLVVIIACSFLIGRISTEKSQSKNSKEIVAITARMMYAQNCSDSLSAMLGTSSNSLFQSKEQMITSAYCYKMADLLYSNIMSSNDAINSSNIVEKVDSSLKKMNEPSNSVSKSHVETVNDEDLSKKPDFI